MWYYPSPTVNPALMYMDPCKEFLSIYISKTLNNQHGMRFKGQFPCLSQETMLYLVFYICLLKDVLPRKSVAGR